MARTWHCSIVALITVLWLSGCCSSSPQKYAILASTQTATVGTDGLPLDTEFWNDLVLTYCTLKAHGFNDENIFALYGTGVDHLGSTHPFYSKPFCDAGNATTEITDIALNEKINNLCNVLCCVSTGRPAEIPGGVCRCLTQGQGTTGIGGFQCSGPPEIPRLKKRDFLVTWIKGHGSSLNCNTNLTIKPQDSANLWFGLSDKTLAALIADLKAKHKVMYFETCDSGGWPKELEPSGAMVATSSGMNSPTDCLETSHPGLYSETAAPPLGSADVDHGRFSHWINVSLRQYDLMTTDIGSDKDSNNLVSIEEGFKTARLGVLAENTDPDVFGGEMNPYMPPPQPPNSKDPACTFLRLPFPTRDHRIFAMDHADDDSIVPSTTVSAGPPDPPGVWIRKNLDGGTTHREPGLGETVFLYARVHNIGCTDPGPVWVKFFLAGLDATNSCEQPTSPKFLGSTLIPSFATVGTKFASVKWEIPEDVDPGKQCMIVVLTALGDRPKFTANSADDNNRVHRLIDIH